MYQIQIWASISYRQWMWIFLTSSNNNIHGIGQSSHGIFHTLLLDPSFHNNSKFDPTASIKLPDLFFVSFKRFISHVSVHLCRAIIAWLFLICQDTMYILAICFDHNSHGRLKSGCFPNKDRNNRKSQSLTITLNLTGSLLLIPRVFFTLQGRAEFNGLAWFMWTQFTILNRFLSHVSVKYSLKQWDKIYRRYEPLNMGINYIFSMGKIIYSQWF